MGGEVVTNGIPVEIMKIDACAATAAGNIMATIPCSRGPTTSVVDIEVKGRDIVLFYRRPRCCWAERYGPTREMPSCLTKINHRGRIQLLLFRNFGAANPYNQSTAKVSNAGRESRRIVGDQTSSGDTMRHRESNVPSG